MPKNWKTYKLGDVLSLLTDYHSSGSYKKLKANVSILRDPSYAVMIRTTNFEKNNFSDFIYVDKSGYDFLVNSHVKKGDILMNKIGNAGSVYYMPELNRPVTLAMNLFLLRFDNSVNQKFMYYNMKYFEPYIKSFAAGSVTQTITKKAVKDLEFILPPLPEQKAIASILSAIDDKIENNLAMNKTLEDMAMALYKHWFVDFGPFKDGKFIDSELGKIPEGWEVKRLDDLCEKIFSGGTPKTKVQEYWHGAIPWLSSGETRANLILETEKTITQLGLDKSSSKMAYRYDIVIASAGQGKTRGQTSLLLIDTSINQSV